MYPAFTLSLDFSIVPLDIFLLKDESLEDSDKLPDPAILARIDRGEPGNRAGAVPGHRG